MTVIDLSEERRQRSAAPQEEEEAMPRTTVGGPIQLADAPQESGAAVDRGGLELALVESRERLRAAMQRLWSYPRLEQLPNERLRGWLDQSATLHAQLTLLADTVARGVNAATAADVASYGTAVNAFVADVESTVAASQPGGTAVAKRRPWMPWAIGAGTLTVLALVGVGIWWITRRRKTAGLRGTHRKPRFAQPKRADVHRLPPGTVARKRPAKRRRKAVAVDAGDDALPAR
ncbi:MAG: hypothetical protein JSV86_19870 [Gemmatimonadota bacterium]|nr:MAG: hypothetical protein JSV86_19870 [Gemmatimonadota bacterium]